MIQINMFRLGLLETDKLALILYTYKYYPIVQPLKDSDINQSTEIFLALHVMSTGDR